MHKTFHLLPVILFEFLQRFLYILFIFGLTALELFEFTKHIAYCNLFDDIELSLHLDQLVLQKHGLSPHHLHFLISFGIGIGFQFVLSDQLLRLLLFAQLQR